LNSPGLWQAIVEVEEHVLVAGDAAHVVLAYHGHVVHEDGDELVHVSVVGQLQVIVVLPHAIAVLGRVIVPVSFEKTQEEGHVGGLSDGLAEDGRRECPANVGVGCGVLLLGFALRSVAAGQAAVGECRVLLVGRGLGRVRRPGEGVPDVLGVFAVQGRMWSLIFSLHRRKLSLASFSIEFDAPWWWSAWLIPFNELALLSVNADRAPDEKCIRK
jgi:hypothetical protein